MPFRMEPLGPSANSSYACGALTVNEVVQMLSGQVRQNMVAILDAAMPAPPLTGIISVDFHINHSVIGNEFG